MTTAQPLSPEALTALAAKLDRFLAGENPIFTREDLAELRKASAFVSVFHGDPKTLKRMADAWTTVEGFVRVGKFAAYGLAFVVVTWTKWDQLTALLGWKGAA